MNAAVTTSTTSPAWPMNPADVQGKATALIELRGMGVRYGDRVALHPLDLRIHAGECVALIGSNGSGKSTLLKLLMGAHPAQDIFGTPGIRTQGQAGQAVRLAMVFQHPFFLHLSVRRNLQLGLWLQGVPRAEWDERIDEGLALVGLSELLDRQARALSGGQQQRLALARAACLRPDVLFLDEPTASLDPSAKREVEHLIEVFRDRGTTLVMSTHNLGQAKRLATRVIYLEQGHALADRPVDHFFLGTDLPEPVQHFLKGELSWPL
jgi:tungstate transport system ATP-binding protein